VIEEFCKDSEMRVFIDSAGWLKDVPIPEFAEKLDRKRNFLYRHFDVITLFQVKYVDDGGGV
jgi:hypothetical protein